MVSSLSNTGLVILHIIQNLLMKNSLLIINIILVLAVGFLFYKVYAKPGTTISKTNLKASSVSVKNLNQLNSIAYVELDSLYEHIAYIKLMRQQLEAEQKAIEVEWERGMRGLESKRDNFVEKKGNTITQQEAEMFQAQLMQEQQTIETKKQNSAGKLSDKSYRFMDDIQTKMRDFLKQYNTQKGYTYILTAGTGLDYMIYKDSSCNITEDVIDGMNGLFSAKK